ncbi:MaoC family dehydratase N-terminal domain-containing protein [Mycetocola zhadangensis]|uniref:FAS1-like dehydratase domain-containing protein n=1 Tax=Mycetocola zhadangensis TaxID=1164595 RepID=UPI003A4DE065
MDTVVTPEMQAALGTEISRKQSYPVDASDIRRWALAVYWPEEPPTRFLGTADEPTLTAPEDFNPFAWRVLDISQHPAASGIDPNDPDRTERQIGVAGPGLKFQLNGGMEATYGAAIRPGDTITSVSRLAGYTEREGRLGHMLISTTEDTWTNQVGELVKRTQQTIIRY